MRDIENWLLDAPNITAPKNFLERLMDRITQENIRPLPVRPVLPTRTIGYALVATAAAMLLITPFAQDIRRVVTEASSAISAFFGQFTFPNLPFPFFGGQ